MHPFSILDIRALQTWGELLAQDKPQWTSSQKLLQLGVLHTKCQPYLVHRHYISQPHSEVVSDNFVEADLRLLNSVISKNNAHCVLALFALRIRNTMIRVYLRKFGQLNPRQSLDGSNTLSNIVSPRKSCKVSIVLRLNATTELSSLTASSTMSLLGLFLRSKIAVLKSFLSPPF